MSIKNISLKSEYFVLVPQFGNVCYKPSLVVRPRICEHIPVLLGESRTVDIFFKEVLKIPVASAMKIHGVAGLEEVLVCVADFEFVLLVFAGGEEVFF